MRRRAGFLLLGLALAACNRDGPDDESAVALVRTYNAKLAESFRTSDVRPVDPFVGLDESKKILGLIGVKADLGIYLDAQLVALAVEGVGRPGKGVVTVVTRERWSYADRRLGTAEQVGEASIDDYQMRYTLGAPEGRWVVVRVEFAAEPRVGRKTTPIGASPEVFHGTRPGPAPAAQPSRKEPGP